MAPCYDSSVKSQKGKAFVVLCSKVLSQISNKLQPETERKVFLASDKKKLCSFLELKLTVGKATAGTDWLLCLV